MQFSKPELLVATCQQKPFGEQLCSYEYYISSVQLYVQKMIWIQIIQHNKCIQCIQCKWRHLSSIII